MRTRYDTMYIAIGAIGAVHVELWPAVKSRGDWSLRMLCNEHDVPVKQRYVCEQCQGKSWSINELVRRGIEWVKGQWIAVSRDDVKALKDASSRDMVVADVVDRRDIPWHLIDGSYHLRPVRGSEQRYQLLRTWLSEDEAAGVGTYVLRGNEHAGIVHVSPHTGLVTLTRIATAERVYDVPEVPEVEVETRLHTEMARLAKTLRRQGLTVPASTYAERLSDMLSSVCEQHTSRTQRGETRDLLQELIDSLKESA